MRDALSPAKPCPHGKNSPADSRWDGFSRLYLSFALFEFDNILLKDYENCSKINFLFQISVLEALDRHRLSFKMK